MMWKKKRRKDLLQQPLAKPRATSHHQTPSGWFFFAVPPRLCIAQPPLILHRVKPWFVTKLYILQGRTLGILTAFHPGKMMILNGKHTHR